MWTGWAKEWAVELCGGVDGRGCNIPPSCAVNQKGWVNK